RERGKARGGGARGGEEGLGKGKVATGPVTDRCRWRCIGGPRRRRSPGNARSVRWYAACDRRAHAAPAEAPWGQGGWHAAIQESGGCGRLRGGGPRRPGGGSAAGRGGAWRG